MNAARPRLASWSEEGRRRIKGEKIGRDGCSRQR
jgi:hypothetical protein